VAGASGRRKNREWRVGTWSPGMGGSYQGHDGFNSIALAMHRLCFLTSAGTSLSRKLNSVCAALLANSILMMTYSGLSISAVAPATDPAIAPMATPVGPPRSSIKLPREVPSTVRTNRAHLPH
jgi:hypothetical protein